MLHQGRDERGYIFDAHNNLLNDTRTRRPIWFVHPQVLGIFNVIPTPTRTGSTVEFVHLWVPADCSYPLHDVETELSTYMYI